MLDFIAKPFGMLLMLLYEWVNNYGIAILFFAIIVRLILLPFQMKSKPGMMRQARIQPKVAEVQKKYASNKTKLNEELAKLYKEEGVNPASGCLWSFLPLPIMFALFLVIRQPLTIMMGVPEALLQRPAFVQVVEGEKNITGKGKAGTTIILTFPENETKNVKVDGEGNWTLDIPVKIKTEPNDKILAVQEGATFTEPAFVQVVAGENEITGKGEPGTTIILSFPESETKKVKVDGEGNWTLGLPVEIKTKPDDKILAVQEEATLTRKFQELGYEFPERADAYEQIKWAQFIANNFEEFQKLDIASLRVMDFRFLGIDLGQTPQWNFLWTSNRNESDSWLAGFALFLIPLISGGVQFAASIVNKKVNPVASTPDGQGKSMQTMMMLMPLISVYFAFITPGALGFYWTIGTVIQVGQDIWLTKMYTKKLDAEDAVKNAERMKKEAEIEAKRIETERKKAEGLIEQNPNTSKRKKQKNTRQENLEKAAEWEKKNAPADEKYEPSRVGNRRYARGRSYDPDRYTRVAEKKDPSSDSDNEIGRDSTESEFQDPELSDDDEFGVYDDEDDGIDYDEDDEV